MSIYDNTRSLIVRPTSIQGTRESVNYWFKPNGIYNYLMEEDPDIVDHGLWGKNTATFEPSFISAPCCADPLFTCGFEQDPPIRCWQTYRFCSPHEGLNSDERTYDSETDSNWCVRSSKYYVRVYGYLSRHFGETSACEGDEGWGNYECGIRVTTWLVDQHFETDDLCWDTRDNVKKTGFKMVCNLIAKVGAQTGYINLDQHYLIELPNLSDGSGPPRVYGYYVEVEQYPKTTYQNERGDARVELYAYKENSRRYVDAESSIALPPTDSWPFDPVLDPGYEGEWELGPYKPPIPYAFWDLQYIDIPKNETYGPLPFDVTDANQVDSTLTIVKTGGPSHGTTSGLSWAMTYTPTPGFTGYDTIYYKAINSAGRYSEETRISFHVQ